MNERGRAPEPPDWALPGDHVDDPAPIVAATRPRRPPRVRSAYESQGQRGHAHIRGAVRAEPRLSDLWVEGEIGRVTISTAGHAYFALKDERSQLQCVWFRDDRQRSRVRAAGRVARRRPRPDRPVRTAGRAPALRRVDPAVRVRRSRPALRGPQGATCRGGPLRGGPQATAADASAHDRGDHEPDRGGLARRLHVLARRWPLTQVVLVAAQVQGDGAPASIVTAFRRLERWIAAALPRRAGPRTRPR